MSFIGTLTQMVDRIEGCAAGVILGLDGILIERYVRDLAPSLDIEVLATEFTTLMRRSVKTAQDTDLGDLSEMTLATDQMMFLVRPITPEYFLLLLLKPGGNVGRARFELRKAQLILEIEFAI